MKKRIAVILTTAAVLGSSLTTFAAPERMPDGGVFDAEYYAQNNPDVAAVLGTDRDALYNHYLSFGINEGRQPYEPGTEQSVPAPVPVVNNASGQSISEVMLLRGVVGTYYHIFLLSDSRPIKYREQVLATGDIRPDRNLTYDAQGNLVGDLGGHVEYDAEGRLIKIDRSTNFQLDESGRMISGYHGERYYYNKQGFLTKIIDNAYSYEFFYNEQNKIVQSKSKGTEGGVWSEEELFFYDEQGRLIRVASTFVAEGEYDRREATINYDAQGRMANVMRSINGNARACLKNQCV